MTYAGEQAKEYDNDWVGECYRTMMDFYAPLYDQARRAYDEDKHQFRIGKKSKKSFTLFENLAFAERMYNLASDIYAQAVKQRFDYITSHYGVQLMMSGYPAIPPEEVQDIFPNG